jgi:hypothetical protein
MPSMSPIRSKLDRSTHVNTRSTDERLSTIAQRLACRSAVHCWPEPRVYQPVLERLAGDSHELLRLPLTRMGGWCGSKWRRARPGG